MDKSNLHLEVIGYNESFTFFEAKSIIWDGVFSSICIFGILGNIVSIIVLSQRNILKNIVYKFFLASVILSGLHDLMGLIFFTIIKNKFHSHSYLLKFYLLYVFGIGMATLNSTIMFNVIMISVKRLFIVINVDRAPRIGFIGVLIVGFVVSLLLQTPAVLSKQIFKLSTRQNDSAELWEIGPTSFGQSHVIVVVHYLLFCFRGLFLPSLVLILNIVMIIKYRAQLKKKLLMKIGHPAESRSLFRTNVSF